MYIFWALTDGSWAPRSTMSKASGRWVSLSRLRLSASRRPNTTLSVICIYDDVKIVFVVEELWTLPVSSATGHKFLDGWGTVNVKMCCNWCSVALNVSLVFEWMLIKVNTWLGNRCPRCICGTFPLSALNTHISWFTEGIWTFLHENTRNNDYLHRICKFILRPKYETTVLMFAMQQHKRASSFVSSHTVVAMNALQ